MTTSEESSIKIVNHFKVLRDIVSLSPWWMIMNEGAGLSYY